MSLERVRSVEEVRANITAFARALAVADPKTRFALVHPTYWVHDPAGGTFAPAKWVAFRDMTADRYDRLLAEQREERIAGFDGSTARRTLERVTGASFNRNPELLSRLISTFESAYGPDAVERNKDSEWRSACEFLLLPGLPLEGGAWTLHPKIAADLEVIHQRAMDEGALLAEDALNAVYSRFAQRFGPKALQDLDGEALLVAMHDHSTKDSLVYWLEFKDDQEFPSGVFGGIAGGSAHKFGLFRSKDGVWIAGKKKQVSVSEAIEIARRHRDQLVAGVELISALPDAATDEDCSRLQRRLEEVAPDVQDSAWGHKYFTLLGGGKLIDFHVEEWQRHNLVRLLQVPPPTPGRYACEGRYSALGRQLGWPLVHLARVLVRRHEVPRAYRRLDLDDGLGDPHWEEMRSQRVVGFPWGETGSLDDSRAQKLADFKPLAAAACRWSEDDAARHASELWGFWKFVAEGDIVVVCQGDSVVGLGKVSGPYRFDPSSRLPHQRSTEWLDLERWTLPGNVPLSKNLHFIPDYGLQVAIERRLLRDSTQPPIAPPPGPVTLDGLPGRIQKVLARKGQVILYGPPGTGKTHWAERTAKEIVAAELHGRPFAQLGAEEQKRILGDGNGYVRICSFHPAYGYEEFIEGYRPEQVEGKLTFSVRHGVFRRICADAAADPKHPYFLIIDEINRGDIPRIFGELITVLELQKRDMPILLPVTGDVLRVPRNLHVIGTMNTADRSIALLDTALRRRFGFIELLPDPAVLGDAQVEGIPLGRWLAALNRRICDNIGRDARNLQVGHSYLMIGGKPVVEFAQLRRIVREDILPLLEEYCYDDWDALCRILGTRLVDEKAQRFHEELFEPDQQKELVQALLGIDPSIATAVGPEPATESEEGAEIGREAVEG